MANTRWNPTPEQEATIRTMVKAGENRAAISKAVDISSHTLKRWLDEHNLKITWEFKRERPPRAQQPLVIPPGEVHYSKDKDADEWVSPAKRFQHLYR